MCVCVCVCACVHACVRACVCVCGFSKSALGEHMVHALISRCVCVTVPLSVLSELNRYETQHFVSQIFTFNLDEKNRAICAAVTPVDPCCSPDGETVAHISIISERFNRQFLLYP